MASHLREEVQVLKCLQQLHDLTHCHLSALIYFSFLHSLTDSLTLCYSSNTIGKLQRQGHWHFLCSHTLFSMAHSPTSFNSLFKYFFLLETQMSSLHQNMRFMKPKICMLCSHGYLDILLSEQEKDKMSFSPSTPEVTKKKRIFIKSNLF